MAFRRTLAAALSVLLAVLLTIPAELNAAWAEGPQLAVNGSALDGKTLPAPFTATVLDPGTVSSAGVTFLVNDSYAGKDTAAPYEWTIADATAHKLKARWIDSAGKTVETVANFTVSDTNTPVLKVNGAKLDGASVTSPFRAVVEGTGPVDAGGVTFLVDDSYAGKATSAPYEYTVVTGAGAHKLKARWKNDAGVQTETSATFTVTSSANPYLQANNAALDGATLPAPFTATLAQADTVDAAGVTFLVDDSYAGKDTSAPYEWQVNAAEGAHKLKARWTSGQGLALEVVANFTVGKPGDPPELPEAVPAKISVAPGPALKRLWTTVDNRRNKVQGLYDWSKVGYGGGSVLPDSSQYLRDEDQCRITATELENDYHVVPDDGGNDTSGLQRAIDDIKKNCSPTGSQLKMSIIQLPKGTLNVTRQISVDADYLRIRGQGTGNTGTKIVFRPDENTRYDKITKDGSRWDLDAMTGEENASGGWIWPGRGLFRVQSRKVAPEYQTAYDNAPANRKDLYEGSVNVHWRAGVKLGSKAGDTGYAARKGDKVIQLDPNSPITVFDTFKVGGMVNVRVANSKKFYEEMKALPTEHQLDNLHMRQQMMMVTAGDPLARTLTLDKPLEFDVPINSTADGSDPIDGKVFDSKVSPIVDLVTNVGFENFAFTQDMPGLDKEKARNNYGNMAPDAAMHGIVFKWAANSWVEGVRSDMTGSHPIVTEEAANLSIVDNRLDGAWNKGKGGNGYFRGSRVWDSLYAGNTTRNLRHFTFQWSAAGNVAIGNSFDSDLNLHGGYERNNLFELNEVSVPYAHRPANCTSNCGDEGGSDPDDSQWYPIWWAAGKKAVKWSGSSGPNNVFHNNHLLKQVNSETEPFNPYYKDRKRIYQFGWDGSKFKHLEQNGDPIADWAHNETMDYTGGRGIVADKTFSGSSVFLRSISLTGYGGPHPQKLQQTWGCSCWDGSGMVNTRLAADPVNTATGALMEHFDDLEVDGLGKSLGWTRTYNSLDGTDGPLSPGWTFAYNASIAKGTVTHDGVTSEVVTYRNGTGGQSQFAKDDSGRYKAIDPAITATLTELADGWQLKNLDGDILRFNSGGQLTHDFDDQGHGVALVYSGGRLSTLTDHLGQTFTVGWGTDGAAAGKIIKVSDGHGRSISYGYTESAGKARLTSFTDVTGATTTFSYDPSTGFVNGITDALGRTTARTTYDPATKRVTSQKDASGATTNFAWDAESETATVTFPDGTTRQDIYQNNVLVSQVGADGRTSNTYYGANNEVIAENDPNQALTKSTYDERGNLLKRTLPAEPDDESPPFEEWTYDSGNRVTSHTDALGNKTTYDYDDRGRLATTTNPDGGTTKLTYTAAGQVKTSTDPLDRTTTFDYNGAGDLVKQTSPGGKVTTWTYDDAHNKLTETSPLGNVSGADPAKYTTRWTYDLAGRELTETDPLGRVTTSTYDGAGQLTEAKAPDGGITKFTYNDNGDPLTETDPLGRVTRYEYDGAGRKSATVGPDGGRTTYVFDDEGKLVSVTGPIGNAEGASAEEKRRDTTTYIYDAADNAIQTRRVDPNDPAKYLVSATTYDLRNQPVTATGPDGAQTRNSYDDNGQITKTVAPDGAETTITYDPLGREKTRTGGGLSVTNTYDKAGQLRRTETGGGAVTTHEYDDDGQLLATVDPRGNVAGADPNDYRTVFTYDAGGQRTKVTDPLGHSVGTEYDPAGQEVKTTDAAGHATTFAHDALGNVQSVTTPTGAVTTYTYDKGSQLTQLKNPRGGITKLTYDDAGRLKTETTPGDRTTTYDYDPAGRLTSKRLPTGQIKYGYDSVGRPTSVDYDDGSPDLAYRYDAASRPVEITQNGPSGAKTTKVSYDGDGRVTKLARDGELFVYDWDANGKLVKRTLPGNRAQSYTYDTDGRVASTTLTGATPLKVDYTYDPAGALKTTTRQDGPTTDRTYDRAGRLTDLRHVQGDTPLVSHKIAWNERGFPSTVTTTRGATATTSTYDYDDDGRLTKYCQAIGGQCTGDSGYTAYGYDPSGNRTSLTTRKPASAGGGTTSTYTTFDPDDRPIQDSATEGGPATTRYTYDDNGNLRSQQTGTATRNFVYGLDANLQQVTLEDGRNVTYAYDENGNRTSRAINGVRDAGWQWDGLGDLATRIAETDANGTVTHQWWEDPVSSLGTALTDAPANAPPTWLLDDYQGSITDAAAKQGGGLALVGSGEQDPFGSPIATTGTYTANPLRFHGQYLDGVTGLYDVRARDYNPATGAFTATDPVKAAAGTPFTNTYHYGYNNPAVVTDPSGEFGFLARVGIGAIVGGGLSYAAHGLSTGDWWSKDAAWAAGSGALAGAFGGGFSSSARTILRLGGYALAGGAGNLMYGWGTSNGGYGGYDALNDFGTGAAWGLAGPAFGGAFRAIKPIIPPQIARWSQKGLEKAWGPLKKALVKCPLINRFIKKEAQVTRNRAAGNAASDRIAVRYPGSKREYSLSAASGRRVIDIFTPGGKAIESKVGRTSYGAREKQELKRDIELLKDPSSPVKFVEWHFSESKVTGKKGPTRQLEEALRNAGVKIVIY
ncbi:RHS repeat-associated core domain-containing protein [Actinomadura terrae]|uniref:RHS repeat-associated core domain-containing protein n=1 Tax=Actinomadura terrae TaxID=604353 RepID=UPI001FA7EAAD|nr:RHS repeat-associated core domain-containing protein [Actinomadura terrae]